MIALGALVMTAAAWMAWLVLFGGPDPMSWLEALAAAVVLAVFVVVFTRVTAPHPEKYKGMYNADPVALGWAVTLGAAGVTPVVAAWIGRLPTDGSNLRTLVFLAVPFGIAVCAGAYAVAATRRRLREGNRLRAQHASATQVPGTLKSIELDRDDTDDETTDDDMRAFDVVVRYRAASGTHEVTAGLVAPSTKVPARGTALRVTYIEELGEDTPVRIELDDTVPIEFETRS